MVSVDSLNINTKEKPVRDIPTNDHDAILQLWHALIGTNGSGLVTRFEKIENVFPELVTQDKCDTIQKNRTKKAGNIFGYIKDVSLVFLSAVALLHGLGVI